ncbi:hypothetical protein B0H13DRAFT_1937504 [Mycena leptocephala]|nr:hypothetical protein B0H13DRAFT_1937504 [Mycena leptocephala]
MTTERRQRFVCIFSLLAPTIATITALLWAPTHSTHPSSFWWEPTMPAVSFVLQKGSVRMHDGFKAPPILCFVFPNLLVNADLAVSFPTLARKV